MNTKNEIVAAMSGEDSTHPPAIFSQTGTVGMMDSCGACWPEANLREDKMIELALQPSKMFGLATARVPFDLTAEAERLGCSINAGDKGTQPAVTGSPWNTGEVGEFPDLMSVDEFVSGGRCAAYISTAERISKEHPELFLTGSVIGPVELACHMLGMENFIMAGFMDPEPSVKWTEKLAPYQSAYAERMSEACDNVFVITEGAEDILSPDMFELYYPSESKVFSSIKDSFSTVHVCGQTDSILERLAEIGATAMSVECHGDPQSVYDRVGDKIVLAGGVPPIDVLLQGTPSDIVAAAKKAADVGYHVITPECGVPPITPNDNIQALSGYREL